MMSFPVTSSDHWCTLVLVHCTMHCGIFIGSISSGASLKLADWLIGTLEAGERVTGKQSAFQNTLFHTPTVRFSPRKHEPPWGPPGCWLERKYWHPFGFYHIQSWNRDRRSFQENKWRASLCNSQNVLTHNFPDIRVRYLWWCHNLQRSQSTLCLYDMRGKKRLQCSDEKQWFSPTVPWDTRANRAAWRLLNRNHRVEWVVWASLVLAK